MKIVVLDGKTLNPGDLDFKKLEMLGCLDVYPRSNPQEVLSRIQDADIVLTNKTVLSKDVLKQCPRLKLISVLATGYDVVDIDAAKEYRICVCNVPGYGTKSVAQFAIALLLEISCNIGFHDRRVQEGAWIHSEDWCFWDKPLIELDHKTMGIIGYGRIGQATASIARALGMHVIALKHHTYKEGVEYVDLKTLCQQSDVISLHCLLNAETKHLINAETLSWMKPSAILINTARGDLIDEVALANALNKGEIFAAGLDVLSQEPMLSDNPLWKANNCLITPHMSWGSLEARRRILDITIENIRQFLNGNPIHQVND